ncbi:MAG: hypothetical protein HQ515_13475 [Phycisphaeraceae bacterium]|nr:hypothetical protein [Phycisphaeraceae bacterium]
MKPSKQSVEKCIQGIQYDASPETHDKVMRRVLLAMDVCPRNHSSASALIGSLIMKSSITKLAIAAVLIMAVIFGFQHVGSNSIAWADVVAQFSAVPYFSATVYIKEGVASDPKQIEFWMSRDQRVRIRTGTQVVFGRKGHVVKAFDYQQRRAVAADPIAEQFLERLSRIQPFSLDAVIRVMFQGDMQDVTPLVNPDAVISQDMVVFDLDLPGTPEWARIWALRESRLPVRMKIWDPRGGNLSDAVFEYAKEQSDVFFDPNAFERQLQSRQNKSRVNMAYANLKDPGGQATTPEDLFAQSGYHLPEIKHVGITPDGAVWVIADKGLNKMPNGRSVYGFSQLKDDLGRAYVRVYASHRTNLDQSRQVFVPAEYPFDPRIPGKLILVCEADDGRVRVEHELIGTVELTQWQQGQSWPADTIRDPEVSFRVSMARKHCEKEQYDEAEKTLVTIQGSPDEDRMALERELVRMHMLFKQAKYAEVVAMGDQLMPAMKKEYQRWRGSATGPSLFIDYLIALACDDQVDRVKGLWQEIKEIKPHLSAKLNSRARQNLAESTAYHFKMCLDRMVPQISRKAHLTIEQINDLFGIDIKQDKTFRWTTFWDWNPEYDKPPYKNWERHLAVLSEHFQTHPLPENMALLERDKIETYGVRIVKMPGIDSHHAENLDSPFKPYARGYRFPESAGRLRIESPLLDVTLNHDLICRPKTPLDEKIIFLLDHFGLEVVEVNEPRTVWVARYDGRTLKDYHQVTAPIPYAGGEQRTAGMKWSASGGGFGVSRLFQNFMLDQNSDYKAAGILIRDETGLTEPISYERPGWTGPEGPSLARKWFADQFGITFTEETRILTTYVIRNRVH